MEGAAIGQAAGSDAAGTAAWGTAGERPGADPHALFSEQDPDGDRRDPGDQSGAGQPSGEKDPAGNAGDGRIRANSLIIHKTNFFLFLSVGNSIILYKGTIQPAFAKPLFQSLLFTHVVISPYKLCQMFLRMQAFDVHIAIICTALNSYI